MQPSFIAFEIHLMSWLIPNTRITVPPPLSTKVGKLHGAHSFGLTKNLFYTFFFIWVCSTFLYLWLKSVSPTVFGQTPRIGFFRKNMVCLF